MSMMSVLESLKTFLQEKVAPTIQLQKPNENVYGYELVHPAVHVGWIPPKGYLPEGMESAIPCLIVGMDEAIGNTHDEELSIRISAVVYSPGKHEPAEDGTVKYTPDFKGYHDLLNLIDRMVAEISRNLIISNAGTVQHPIRRGIYQQEQPYPYWYGWISFTLRRSPYPNAEIFKNL